MIDVVTKYGLDMSGATDNAPKLALLGSDIAILHDKGRALPRLVFSEGLLKFSAWPDLAYDNLQIVAEGECVLEGSVVFDASKRNPAASEPGIRNLLFSGFDVHGDITFSAIHRSNLSVMVSEGNGPAIALNFCIITKIHPVIQGHGRPGLVIRAWPGKPKLQSTACTIDTPILENCSIGLDMVSAGSFIAQGGTIESCGIGVHLGDAAGHNAFYSVEMEGNGADVKAEGGAHGNNFMYCGNSGKLNTNFGFLSSNWYLK